MARYTGPLCRLCRAEQKKLFLKGDRCKTDKCPINKKRPIPGKDPKARTGKRSDYGVQLREKQRHLPRRHFDNNRNRCRA